MGFLDNLFFIDHSTNGRVIKTHQLMSGQETGNHRIISGTVYTLKIRIWHVHMMKHAKFQDDSADNLH